MAKRTAVISDSTYAALDELYARIPKMECRGKCQGACGPIDMSTAEHRRIVNLGVSIPRVSRLRSMDEIQPTCPALTMLGTCQVYEVRPLVCRLWGAIKSMDCSHGCKPEGGYLSEQWGVALMLLVAAIGEGRRLTVDEALAQTAYLNDPTVLHAWMNYRAATSNPYSDHLRKATANALAAEMANYRRRVA